MRKKNSVLFLLVVCIFASVRNAGAQDYPSSSPRTTEDKSLAYVYLIDMSTSMEWIFDDVKGIIKEAVRRTHDADSVTLILFGDEVTTLASYESMNEIKKETICKYLDEVYATSVYTNIGLALTKGVEYLHERFLNKPAKEYVFILVTDGKDHPPPAYKRDRSTEGILTRFSDFVPGRDWSFRYIVLEGQFDPELLSCVKKFGESSFDVETIARKTRLTESQIIEGILAQPQDWVAFPIAVVDHVGQVEIRKADQTGWAQIPEGQRQRVVIGDAIRTGPESEVNITFGATGQAGVQENTLIQLKQSRVDPVTKGREIEVHMERGAIWNALNVSQDRPLTYDVVTPIAITGVRGTQFRVILDEKANTQNVAVIDGTVEISSQEAQVFNKFTVPAGTATDIPRGKKPSPPQPLSEKILLEWQKWKKALLTNEPLSEINFVPVHVIPDTVKIVLGPIKPASKEIKKFPIHFDRQYFGKDRITAEASIDLPPGAEIKAEVEDTADPREKNLVVEVVAALFLKYTGQNEYFGTVSLSCADPTITFKDKDLKLMVIHDPPTFSDTVRGLSPRTKALLVLLLFLPILMAPLVVWRNRREIRRRMKLVLVDMRERIRLLKLVRLFPSRPCGQLILQNDDSEDSQKVYDLAEISRTCKKMVLRIGSSSSNAIYLPQTEEPFRCIIWAGRKRNPTKMFIGSADGTVAVNAESLKDARQLNDKDIIEVGPHIFKFIDTQSRSQIKVFMMSGKMYKGMLEYWDLSQSIFFMVQMDKEKERFRTIRFDEVLYVHYYKDQSERERRFWPRFRKKEDREKKYVRVILKSGKKLSGFVLTKGSVTKDALREGAGIFLIPDAERSKIQYTYIPLSAIRKVIE